MASPPPSPVRQKLKIVDDERVTLRREIVARAHELEKHLHYQAAVKPHLEKLQEEVLSLSREYAELEKTKKKLEDDIAALKDQKKARKGEVGQDRSEKIAAILALESRLEDLLTEKAGFLAPYEEQ
jgi:septal ring factor EnvC (AmiA/AmiB activator)